MVAVLASGCASAVLRVSLSGESPGTMTVADKRVPIPAEPYLYFAGTRFDATCVAQTIRDVSGASNAPPELGADPAGEAMLAPFCLVDLPLSAILDSVLLPFDVWAHWHYAEARVAGRERVGR